MKKFFKAISLVFLLSVVGCSTTEITYNSRVDIKPAPQPDQYYMSWLLTKGANYDGDPVFSSPEMVMSKNKQIIIQAGELVKVRCVVLVTDVKGVTQAKTEVVINNTENDVIWTYTGVTVIDNTRDLAITKALEKEQEKK
jgi:hypothetical protein